MAQNPAAAGRRSRSDQAARSRARRGAPPEPEQAARNRAELNYHLGLLSAAEATVNSSNLRIDNLLDKIQDVRRKNFTSALFQPIPGLYAYDTWANVPQYIPDAAHRVRDLVADWRADPQIAATLPVPRLKPC